MNKKQIIYGSIIVIILIIIGFIVLNSDNIFKGSSLDLNAEILNNSDSIDDLDNTYDEEQQSKSIVVEFVNMEELTKYLTITEVNDLEKKLSRLFIEYFPRIGAIRGDYNNYYSQNKQEIQTETGIESENEFTSLINKLKPVKDYNRLKIVLQIESLKVIENNYFVDFSVIFDEHSEVEFYAIIDLNDLEIIIK